MSGFNFGELDLTDVAADDGPPKRFLEVGNHDVRIKEAMIKETSARTGRFLVFGSLYGRRRQYLSIMSSFRPPAPSTPHTTRSPAATALMKQVQLAETIQKEH